MTRLFTAVYTGCWICCGLWASAGLAAPVQESPEAVQRPPSPPRKQGGLSIREVFESLQQLGDDELEPAGELAPETPQQRSQRAAVAWYMVGQVHESRNEFEKAADAYKQAIQEAPAELPPYQSLMSIAFAQRKRDEAIEYALQAVQHNPEGLQLARGLAALLVRAGTTSEGIDLLQQVQQRGRFAEGSLANLIIHRDLGVYFRLSGKNDEAAENYRIVFAALQRAENLSEEERQQLVGDDGATFEEMGEVFLDAKQPDLAVKAFEQAAKYSKSRPGQHSFNLATVYRQTGRPQEALDELQGYFNAQLQSKGRAAYQLLKDLLAELERSDELLPRLERMLEKDELNKGLRYFVADQYVEDDRLEQAEKLLSETIGGSKDPRGLVGLAAVYHKQGQAAKLLEALSEAFAVIPQTDEEEMLERLTPDVRALIEQFDDLQTSIAEDNAIMDQLLTLAREKKGADPPALDFVQTYLVGKLSLAAERTDDAVEFYRAAIDMQNDPPAMLFRELSFHLIDVERFREAAETMQIAIEHGSPRLQGTRTYFQYLQSHAWEMAGETDLALAAIQEALKGAPDNVGLRFQEAWVYYHAHRFEEAITAFEQVIADFENDSDEETRKTLRNCQFSLSAIHVQQGNFDEGEDILLRVLQDEPENTQANNDLGYLWADQNKNLEQARSMIKKALKAEPDNAAYLDSMGWVLFRLGKFEQARKHLEQATATPRGEDSTIFEHLGDTYDKLGLPEQAQDAWRNALKLEQEKPHPDPKLLERIQQKVPDAPAEKAAD